MSRSDRWRELPYLMWEVWKRTLALRGAEYESTRRPQLGANPLTGQDNRTREDGRRIALGRGGAALDLHQALLAVVTHLHAELGGGGFEPATCLAPKPVRVVHNEKPTRDHTGKQSLDLKPHDLRIVTAV